jgi:hypothetical protein
VAIRLRIVSNRLIALCAAKSVPLPNDIYLDDAAHGALAEKFARDWNEAWGLDIPYDTGVDASIDAEEASNVNRENWDEWQAQQVAESEKEIIQRVHHEEIIGKDAAQIARHKSKYGRRAWVVWQDKQNHLHAAPSTVATVKAAMLATGTQGRFTTCYSGVSHVTDWWTANNMRRRLKRESGE